MASDIQKPKIVSEVHVLRSTGVTSESMFDQLSLSAKDVSSFGKTHPECFVFALRLAPTDSSRPRSTDGMVEDRPPVVYREAVNRLGTQQHELGA